MPKIVAIPNSGSRPDVNQLALGDLAINTYDGKAYLKKQAGTTLQIVEIGTGGGGTSVSASYADYAVTSSFALNGGVTQLIAGTNVTLSPTNGKGVVTVNAVLASSGSGTPNGPLYSLQFNNGGLFSGSGNFTLLNNTDLYLTGSLITSGSNNFTGSQNISGSLQVTGSFLVKGTTVTLDAATIKAPLLPSSTPPGGATLNTVLVDQSTGTLYVTSSLPGTGGGGFVDRIVTGSITASVDIGTTSDYFFLIQSGSNEILKVNTDRILVFEPRNDIPSPITGGIYYSASGDFFFGL